MITLTPIEKASCTHRVFTKTLETMRPDEDEDFADIVTDLHAVLFAAVSEAERQLKGGPVTADHRARVRDAERISRRLVSDWQHLDLESLTARLYWSHDVLTEALENLGSALSGFDGVVAVNVMSDNV
jgi:hypothetical protein